MNMYERVEQYPPMNNNIWQWWTILFEFAYIASQDAGNGPVGLCWPCRTCELFEVFATEKASSMVHLLPHWPCLNNAILGLLIMLSHWASCFTWLSPWWTRQVAALGMGKNEAIATEAAQLEVAQANCNLHKTCQTFSSCAELLCDKTTVSGQFCTTNCTTATLVGCKVCLDVAEAEVACFNLWPDMTNGVQLVPNDAKCIQMIPNVTNSPQFHVGIAK